MQNNRYEVLDGMRGVAAISVMLMHYLQHTDMPMFKSAYLSVDVFFMMSGFILAHSYGDRILGGMSVGDYLVRRAIRLYPMFLISMFIGIPALFIALRTGATSYSLGNFVASSISGTALIPYLNHLSIASFGNTLATPIGSASGGSVFPTNPPGWSLFFEAVVSLAFPVFMRLSPKSLFRVAFISIALLALNGVLVSLNESKVSMTLDQGWGTANFIGGFPRVFYGFVIGIMIFKLRPLNSAKPTTFLRKAMGSDLMLFLCLLLTLSCPASLGGFYAMFVLVLIGPILVLRGALISPSNGLMRKVSVFLGWISYPVYCLHYPIGRLVFLLMPHSGGRPILAAAVSAAASIVAAVLLTKFLEEPIRSVLSSHFLGRIVKSSTADSPSRAEFQGRPV